MEDGGAIAATTTRVQNELLPKKKIQCKPPRLPRRAAPIWPTPLVGGQRVVGLLPI